MLSERSINEQLERIAKEVPGFIGASLVDLESGMTLGLKTLRDDFDLDAASAFNSEMVKQNLKILKALNLKTHFEDLILTLGDQIHMMKLVNPSTFMYLAAERGLANLAIVRNAVHRSVMLFE
jgi:hypothetical protein